MILTVKKWLYSPVLVAGLMAISSGVLAEEAPLTLDRKLLTLDAAQRVAQTSIQACRKKGINVAVTVVDRSGVVLVSLRDSLAMPVTVEISRQKAVTALSFNAKTSTLTNRFKLPGTIAKVDQLLFMAGGVPINAGGHILGAAGVSGAPASSTDEQCANAGVNSVLSDIEMSL